MLLPRIGSMGKAVKTLRAPIAKKERYYSKMAQQKKWTGVIPFYRLDFNFTSIRFADFNFRYFLSVFHKALNIPQKNSKIKQITDSVG